MKVITKNPKQTKNFGLRLAKKLRGSEIIALYGDLGGGKTTLIKGLGQGLNIKKRILSPSFVLMKIYPLKNKRAKFLKHLDLYRLKSSKEIEALGIKNQLRELNVIWAIEWAQKIKKILPKSTIKIHLKYLDKNSRAIEIKNLPSYLKQSLK